MIPLITKVIKVHPEPKVQPLKDRKEQQPQLKVLKVRKERPV